MSSNQELLLKPFFINVETTTAVSDDNAIIQRDIVNNDFIIDIFLNKDDFRSLFEDLNTTATGSKYNPNVIEQNMYDFFKTGLNTNNNNIQLSNDLYRVLMSTFNDISVDVSKLEKSCASNLSQNIIYNYYLNSLTTNQCTVTEDISNKLDNLIQRNNNEDPYHYSSFWNNSVEGNAIVIEGSIQTPSNQTLNLKAENYTHANEDQNTIGWLPISLRFQHSEFSFNYKN